MTAITINPTSRTLARRVLNRHRDTMRQIANADMIRANLQIMDKHARLIPYVPNRVQAHYRANKTNRDLILKARQQGISTEIQAEQYTAAVTSTALCVTIAHDSATTQKLRRMALRFHNQLPASIRPERGLDNAITTTYPQTNSEVTIATAGNVSVGLGGTYTRFHGSEVARWKDAESIMTGIMQGIPLHGEIALESTAWGAQGWFYERCLEAYYNPQSSIWKLHFYAWFWDDTYQIALNEGESLEPYSDDELYLITTHNLTPEQIKWRRYKIKELPHTFKQEYPEDVLSCFLTSGNSYFATIHNLELVFSVHAVATEKIGKRIGGVDFGQKNDYTAICILDMETYQELEIFRINQLDWKDIRAHIIRLCRKWQLDYLIIEENAAGSVNIAELFEELDAAGLEVGVQSFYTSPQSKPPLIQGLYWAMSEGGLKLQPDPIAKNEIMTFVASQTPSGAWKYEAIDGAHDDTVIARALAWHGCMNMALEFKAFW